MISRRKKSIVELTRVTEEAYRKLPKLPLRVLVEDVRSLQNVGSIFRTSDAFLVEEVILAGISGCPPHPELLKTSLGAERSVAWRHVESGVEEALRLQTEGWKLVVAEQTLKSTPLQHFEPSVQDKWLLVVGNEVQGVSQRLADMADTVVEIPQAGTKHSLNVAVCAGILLWHFYQHLKLPKANHAMALTPLDV